MEPTPRSVTRRAVLLTALQVAALRSAAAQPAPSPAPRAHQVATVEGITEYRLPNGLAVLLVPDASKPTVTVNMTYLVGSRHEGYGESGMAHLLEHMVFKGTPRHPNIPRELAAHGARPNGTTSYDRTNYFETMPAADANLDWALDLEADRMLHSRIAAEDLATEFTVVRNELEAGENDPGGVLVERVIAAAYDWHGYGRSTGGSRSDIEHVPVDRLRAFYRRYYQPDNAVLVVAGKLDPARTLRAIAERFGRIPRPLRSAAAGTLIHDTYTAEPTQDGERSVVVRRVGDAPVVVAAHHVPAGSHPDFAAVAVLARILGDSPSGRLHAALVAPGLAARVTAMAYQLREPGLLITLAMLRSGQSTDSAAAALVGALEGAATSPVTEDEVARARTFLLKELELGLNNSELVGYNLTEWAAMGDWRLRFLHRDRLARVSAADVRRVAAAYLQPSNRTVGVFIPTAAPTRAEIPAAPSAMAIASMVRDYHGRAAVSAGEAFDAGPRAIEARVERSALASGMQLQLLPKRTRGDRVLVQLQLRFGTERSLAGRAAVADLTAALLARGTVQLTRAQVKDSLDRLKARLTIGGGAGLTTVNLETTRDFLLPALDLVAQQLRAPRLDSAELDALRRERLAQVDMFRGEPQILALVRLQRALQPRPKEHPQYVAMPAEQSAMYAAVTAEQVRAFHRDFYGASHADAAVVGSFDADSVRAAFGRLFGDWRSASPYERVARAFVATDSGTMAIETPDKANAVFVAGENIALGDDDPDFPALTLANWILGGGFLESRLATRIRQREGISYGVGSALVAPPLDRAAVFQAFAICAPPQIERLAAAFREEVERVRRDGFSAAEVEAAKSGFLQQRLQSRANDGELIGALIAHRVAGRTLAYDEALDARIRALGAGEVTAAARRHLDLARMVQVRAGDFAKR